MSRYKSYNDDIIPFDLFISGNAHWNERANHNSVLILLKVILAVNIAHIHSHT